MWKEYCSSLTTLPQNERLNSRLPQRILWRALQGSALAFVILCGEHQHQKRYRRHTKTQMMTAKKVRKKMTTINLSLCHSVNHLALVWLAQYGRGSRTSPLWSHLRLQMLHRFLRLLPLKTSSLNMKLRHPRRRGQHLHFGTMRSKCEIRTQLPL